MSEEKKPTYNKEEATRFWRMWLGMSELERGVYLYGALQDLNARIERLEKAASENGNALK